MISRFSLILFTTLFLFGCATSNNSNKNEMIADDPGINKTSIIYEKNKYSKKNNPNITNQKEAIEFLGKPDKKNIYVLSWNLSNDIDNKISYNEYVDVWFWNKSTGEMTILFDIEGKVHNKIQFSILDFLEGKSVKELKMKNNFDCRKNCIQECVEEN